MADRPVEISQSDAGLYIAKFKLEADKQRVVDGGPWLFSRHLVNFKRWIPNTHLHCYDFTHCALWVQVYGLPLEWSTEQLIRKAIHRVGNVLEVKSDTKEGSTLRNGRVRIDINLQEPLKTGKLIRIDGKTLWLDFRYERLPHFCYSCGKLGHYATYCKDYPYDEAQIDGKNKMAYGQWLRAEVREHSP